MNGEPCSKAAVSRAPHRKHSPGVWVHAGSRRQREQRRRVQLLAPVAPRQRRRARIRRQLRRRQLRRPQLRRQLLLRRQQLRLRLRCLRLELLERQQRGLLLLLPRLGH